MKRKSTTQLLKETTQYIEFLEKRLASANYKANVSLEEFEKTRLKLAKAKFLFKTLKK